MISETLRSEIRLRAQGVCEYCCMPEQISSLSFQVDHIIAQPYEGSDELSNLVWSCTLCNLAKVQTLAVST